MASASNMDQPKRPINTTDGDNFFNNRSTDDSIWNKLFELDDGVT